MPRKKEKHIYRSKDQRLLGGVCSGFAEYFNVDPSVIRLLWIILTFVYGSGFILYFILWVILPEEK